MHECRWVAVGGDDLSCVINEVRDRKMKNVLWPLESCTKEL